QASTATIRITTAASTISFESRRSRFIENLPALRMSTKQDLLLCPLICCHTLWDQSAPDGVATGLVILRLWLTSRRKIGSPSSAPNSIQKIPQREPCQPHAWRSISDPSFDICALF